MKLLWLPLAEADRDSQLGHLAEDNFWAAIDAGDAIAAAVRRLGQYPEIGRVGRVKGTRELVVADTPYLIAYRIEVDLVVILRLFHGAQKWPSRF